MATIFQNVNSQVPPCGTAPTRSQTQLPIDDIITQIDHLEMEVAASSNPKIRNIKVATTFPVDEIQNLLAEYPDAEYLRVYNGLDTNGIFITHLAPLNENFAGFVQVPDSSQNKIIQSCCHCNPCVGGDSLLPTNQ